ncbi:MAG: RIP metalloprotease RseP [Rhodospirillales bacterium]|nr:RIP metalloprotease RseP [Rhodospirillales bacterium]
MDFLANVWSYTGPFLLVLTVLVFVHELGHYLVARKNGVRVEVFSIGFGPEIFGWNDTHGTRWKISWVPLGGYVKFFGDAGVASRPDAEHVAAGADELPDGENEDRLTLEQEGRLTPEQQAESYHFKTVGQRSMISAAGPVANFIFAILLLAGLYSFVGQPFTPAVVGGINPDSPAERAGFQIGDQVVKIDDSTIERFEDMQQIVRLSLGEPMVVIIIRDGQETVLSVSPEVTEYKDRLGNIQRIGLLGITRSGVEYIRHGPFDAIVSATKETFTITEMTLKAVGQMIIGARTAEDLGGPIQIAKMSGQMAEQGVVAIIWFMAVLSINLGLINLFPVPMLDGGHLLFYFFEAVRGRPLSEKVQEYGFRIGISMILMLMLFATWNDLSKLPVFDFFTKLLS